MDPRRVLTFRAVAHHRSFSRAARELSLTQPSVSNQVAQLERELGARVLHRGPGGLRLTPEGEILLDHADAIAQRLQLASSQLAAATQGRRRRLRIGALPTALAGFVPAAIALLRAEHPSTRITIDEGTSPELAQRVASGELDLAIAYQDTASAPDDPPGITRHHLLDERFMVALAPDHPLAAEREVRIAELSHQDWTATLTDGVIVRACRSAGFEPNLISLTRDQLAIRALVMGGLAVTLVPELLADPFRGLALRPIADVKIAREVYALLAPGGHHPLLGPILTALDTVAAQLGARSGSEVTEARAP